MVKKASPSLFDLLDKVLRDLATGQGARRVSINLECSSEPAAKALASMLAFANDWNDEEKIFSSPETSAGTFTTIVGAATVNAESPAMSTDELLQSHNFRYEKKNQKKNCHFEIASSHEETLRWEQRVNKMIKNLAVLKKMVFEERHTMDDQPIIINKESELAATANEWWQFAADKKSRGLTDLVSYVTMRLEEYHSGYEGPGSTYTPPRRPKASQSEPWKKEEETSRPAPRQPPGPSRGKLKRQKRQAELEKEPASASPPPPPEKEDKPTPFALPEAQAKALKSLTNIQGDVKRWNGMVMQDALTALTRADTLDTNIDWQKQLAEMLIGQNNLKRVMKPLGLHKAFFGSDPAANHADASTAERDTQANKEWLAKNPQAVIWLQDHAAAIPGINLLLTAALQPSTTRLEDTAKALRKEYSGVSLEFMRQAGEVSQEVLQAQVNNALGRGKY